MIHAKDLEKVSLDSVWYDIGNFRNNKLFGSGNTANSTEPWLFFQQ